MILQKKSNLLQPLTVFKRIEINLLTFPLLFFGLIYRFSNILLMTYIIVLIHESAHLITALKLGVKPEKIVIMPFGITLRINSYNIRNPKDEMKIAAAGPLSNIIMSMAVTALYYNGIIKYDLFAFLFISNISISLINLFPALPLDGGRILRAYLTEKCGYIKATNITMIFTKITIVALSAIGLFILYKTKFNFSALIISSFLITNFISEQRGSKMIMMREILYSRQKLTDDGIAKTGVISIMENTPAKKALKFLSYNKYYTINLIDENMNILGSMTETKLIERLIDCGIRSKAKEIFNK